MSTPRRSWSTPFPAGLAILIGGIVLIAAAAASYREPAGMLLLGLAGLGLLAVGTIALTRRPRLTLSLGPGRRPELTIRTLRGLRTLTPESIDSVELLGTRRLLFSSTQLLIDDGDGGLYVFSRWDLGESPQAVAEELTAAGLEVRQRL